MELTGLIFAALASAKKANERIDTLPLPMIFKGTLGVGGTISTLPTASSENEGFVYIVITDGTYAGQTAKAGDTFVSDGSTWVLVPSGDEPSVIDDSVTSTALTWSSDKIVSELGGLVKTIEYTGVGAYTKTVAFPVIPKVVIFEQIEPSYRMTMPIFWGYPDRVAIVGTSSSAGGTAPTPSTCGVSFNDDTKEITIDGGNSQVTAFNVALTHYAVHYI